jgi:tRNA (guanine-N7-)-methyltransferase
MTVYSAGTPMYPTRAPTDGLRTFHPRKGRLSARHEQALGRLLPVLGVPVAAEPGPALDTAALFGRAAPVVVEIGSGMGDATAAMAAADPDRDYLALDVHLPGIANLLRLIDDAGLTNLRVGYGDALDLLRHQVPVGHLDAVHAFFPDPWPKARHHKRRLIQPANVALLASRLRRGGTLHCSTDWAEYAGVMLATLTASPDLVNAHPGFAPCPGDRPLTKFEQRGAAAGRAIFDLVFRRS